MTNTKTKIEWTEVTWSPVVGCTKVSQGCRFCYAKDLHDRRHKAFRAGKAMPAQYAEPFETVQLMPERLEVPLHWKKPRTVFVNSVSDLFHEDVPFEFIDRVFAVMALTPQHTYQVLTKRPERMREYLTTPGASNIFIEDKVAPASHHRIQSAIFEMVRSMAITPAMLNAATNWHEQRDAIEGVESVGFMPRWPLPNVWLGVSVENQAAAEQRISVLLETPAAVRFLSCEPLLGPVDLERVRPSSDHHLPALGTFGPDWVIVGGESGTGARPCDVEWIRSIVQQCQAAGVAVFVKQLGAKPYRDEQRWRDDHGQMEDSYPRDVTWLALGRKGGDMEEWPEDLRVREMPR